MKANIPFSIAANAEQFLLGIAAEEAANTRDKEKAFKKLNSQVEKIKENLRDSYDSLIPNVFVANIDTFTNLIANNIIKNPEKFYDDPKSSKDIIDKFGKRNSKEYINLRLRIHRLLLVYHGRLLATQESSNPIMDLNNISRDIFSRTLNINNDISARVLGVAFGKSIRRIFANKSVLAVVDPMLGSSPTTFVFFSSSFDSIGSSLREKVYTPLLQYLRATLLGGEALTRSDFRIGNIVNLGHAALVNELGIYINTPAFAKSLFVVAKGGSKKFAPSELSSAASFFKKESRVAENKIEVSKNLTSIESGYGILLALGITFTLFEDSVINSERGRQYERQASIAIIGRQEKSTLTAKQKNIVVQKLFRIVLRLNPVLGRSGKNIIEFIEESLAGILLHKKVKPVRYKATKTKKYVKTTYTPVAKPVSNKSYSKILPNTVKLNTKISSIKSALDLTTIINSLLHDQIKKNMGTGTDRRVLNYRTGRLARSAKVERISESRQGMITAFYSYMKNPYATFSEGGRQQYPRSRDPKTLISKSVREIAQTLVTNQLRAVNV